MSVEPAPNRPRHWMVSFFSGIPKRLGPLALALLIVLGSMLAYFSLIGHPLWGTNDDVGMSMMGAGVWTSSRPSAELSFIHPYYGWLIRELCTWQPDVPWYGISFIVISALSLVALDYSILRVRKQGPFSLLVLFATVATVLPALWHLQFTLVAGLAALAGAILLVSVFTREPATRRSFVVAVFVSLCLLLLGSMIRFVSALMVVALVTPCAIAMLLTSARTMHPAKSRWRRMAIGVTVGGVLCVSMLGLRILQRKHYEALPGWTQWSSLNVAKAEFIDLERIKYDERTHDIFGSVGWNRNDHEMIVTWQYVDSVRYSPEKFCRVVSDFQAAESAMIGWADGWEAWTAGLGRMTTGIGQLFHYAPTIMFGILAALLLAIRWTRQNVLYVGAAACTTIVVLVYLHWGLGRSPLRVLLVLWSSMLWMTMLIAAGSDHGQAPHWMRWEGWKAVARVVLVLTLLGTMYHDCRDARCRVAIRMEQQKSLERTLDTWSANLPPGSIIYCVGAAFPYEYHLPLKSFAYLRSIDGFIVLGWGNQSPQQREVITALGLDDDFFASLARQEHVYMVKRPRVARLRTRDISSLCYHYKKIYGLELSIVEEPDLPLLHRMVFCLAKEEDKEVRGSYRGFGPHSDTGYSTFSLPNWTPPLSHPGLP